MQHSDFVQAEFALGLETADCAGLTGLPTEQGAEVGQAGDQATDTGSVSET